VILGRDRQRRCPCDTCSTIQLFEHHTIGTFRTAIDRRNNGGVLLNVLYRHSRIKQYLKDGRACASKPSSPPRDLGCNARLPNLDALQVKARACNRRILDAQRVGQGCVLASPAFERIAHPTVDAAGCRTPALRFGDPRVMALTGALPHPARRNRHHFRPDPRWLAASLRLAAVGESVERTEMVPCLRRRGGVGP